MSPVLLTDRLVAWSVLESSSTTFYSAGFFVVVVLVGVVVIHNFSSAEPVPNNNIITTIEMIITAKIKKKCPHAYHTKATARHLEDATDYFIIAQLT